MADLRLSHHPTLVRRLWLSDRQAVLDYFSRLDSETRANRFMGQVSEAGIRAYADQAMAARGVMFGAFVDGTLRGLGELRPAGPGQSSYFLGPQAEAAFAVERAYRRQGLGASLFGRITQAARNRGVSDLHVRCFSRNGPMIRLATRQGAALIRDGLEADGALHLDRATPLSFWYGSIAEAFDFTLSVTMPPADRRDAA
ncbi:GNAT family N-acetyltransferase [Methylobacterium sp. J-076]|uniref:GNAT family N-acetyltransferase n=1 Tax=Methylobacterium sp. J-076 TaxID=2836655 RepID=UPI001FBAA9E0|nr:GNAT family N-acetyltransferase [Methylobacterium sp. J-076]MCJ2015523.1 GNAT family N-acetyltransferase [Methylobacterium sp. J-076]